MSQMTIDIPSDIRAIMDSYPDVNWQQIARHSVSEHAKKLKLLDELTKNSTLTEADVEELDKKVKRGLAERYAKLK
ncbi:MAG: hypothetical protein AAB344_01465 [Bacteroidota bacterium]